MSPLSYFTERASEVCGQIRVYSRSNGGKISVRLPVKEQNWHKIPHGFSFNTLFCFVQVLPQNKRIPVTPSLLFINKCKSVFLSFSLLNLIEFWSVMTGSWNCRCLHIFYRIQKLSLKPSSVSLLSRFSKHLQQCFSRQREKGTSEFGNNRLCYL